MTNEPYHIPALLPEAIEGLNINPSGTYVDATFGGGGHSRAIVEKLSAEGHLYGFDQDIQAVERAFADPRFTIVHGNFRYLSNFLRFYGAESVDGILADLGVSFHHFDDPTRGFSFRWDGPLDMRMNPSAKLTAASLLQQSDERRLASIFRTYGEFPKAQQLARAIVSRRASAPIATVEALLDVARPLVSPKQEKKELAQIFQALRIEVNGEMDALRHFLAQAVKVLRHGGRLVVITYHSLEDRMVKNLMRSGNVEGDVEKDFYGRQLNPLRLITRKPIVASEAEVEANPRSRSAKMRIAEKI